MSQVENIVIAVIELVLAAMFFQRVMPTVLDNKGKVAAFESWCVAVTLLMFGAGRLVNFLEGVTAYWTFAVGHISLIALALSYYSRKMANGLVKWTEQKTK